MTAQRARCAVVVATRDRPAHLARLFRALSQLRGSAPEIIVVDNAPSNHATRDLTADAGARYVLESRPGLSHARNRGASATNAPLVAFIDDDAIPAADWLERLVADFDDDTVAAVTGRCVPSPAVGSEASRALMQEWWPSDERRKTFDRRQRGWAETAIAGSVGVGMNMAVRREVFLGLDGFDGRMGRGALITGGEEHDLFYRILEMGHRIVYTPHAVVQHPALEDVAEFPSFRARSYAGHVAHLLLLFFERPESRGPVLRLLRSALIGSGRPDRAPHAPEIAGKRVALLKSFASGFGLFMRSRTAGDRVSAPPQRPAAAAITDSAAEV